MLICVFWAVFKEERAENSPWKVHMARRPVVLVDGTSAEGYVWVRKVNGRLEYSRMTADEVASYQSDMVW